MSSFDEKVDEINLNYDTISMMKEEIEELQQSVI